MNKNLSNNIVPIIYVYAWERIYLTTILLTNHKLLCPLRLTVLFPRRTGSHSKLRFNLFNISVVGLRKCRVVFRYHINVSLLTVGMIGQALIRAWKYMVQSTKYKVHSHSGNKGAVSSITPSAPICSSRHFIGFHRLMRMLWAIRFHPSHRLFSRLRNHSAVSLSIPLGN